MIADHARQLLFLNELGAGIAGCEISNFSQNASNTNKYLGDTKTVHLQIHKSKIMAKRQVIKNLP